MKKEEVEKLEAGRELDALIAEKVMGWKWFEHTGYPIRYFRPPNRFNYGAIWESGEVEYLSGLPHYSTDISAAFQVWEKFRESGKPEPDYWTLIDGGDTWIITSNWAHHDGDIENFRVEHESFSLAICRAALLATCA